MGSLPLYYRTYFSLLQGLYAPAAVCAMASQAGLQAVGLIDINTFSGLVSFTRAAVEKGLKPLYGVSLYGPAPRVLNRGANNNSIDPYSINFHAANPYSINPNYAGPRNAGLNATGPDTGSASTVHADWEGGKKVSKQYLCTLLCLNKTGFARANGIITAMNYQSENENTYDPIDDLCRHGYQGLWVAASDIGILEKLDRSQSGTNSKRANSKQPAAQKPARASRPGPENKPYPEKTLFAALFYGTPFSDLHRWARDRGIPCLALNEGVYCKPAEKKTYHILRAIDLNTLPELVPEKELLKEKHRVISCTDLEAYFSAVPEALQNTKRFAMIAEGFSLPSKPLFPGFNGFADETSFLFLKRLCLQGVVRRYGKLTAQVKARLNQELSIIKEKGFSAYFLVVWDVVTKYPRTCGRGSAASSIVSYLLGITHVDPIKHDLFFYRFLNSGRQDPPDIDVDFPWDEREKALAYVFKKYAGSVAMVADYVTFGRRSALREPARVMGIPGAELEALTREWVDHGRKPSAGLRFTQPVRHNDTTETQKNSFKKGRSLGPEKELPAGSIPRSMPRSIPQDLLRAAGQLYSMPRHLGTHPGGVVITPGPVRRYIHLQSSNMGRPLAPWNKDDCEAAGLVKIDFLGNRSLAVLRDTIELVNQHYRHENPIVWDTFDPLEDAETKKAIAQGDTLGIFYVESPATRQLLQKMGQGDYQHLVVASSIIRPAANRCVNEYLRRLHGGVWQPLPPPLDTLLQETFGILVFQEDVSKTAMAAAGFSAAESDRLRRVVTKKVPETVKQFRESFFQGARSKKIPPSIIEELWQGILSFDGYSFCKAHSASYALVSYKLAWLKTYYPLEFYVCVINNGGGYYAKQVYINQVRRLGFDIWGPDINKSELDYSIEVVHDAAEENRKESKKEAEENEKAAKAEENEKAAKAEKEGAAIEKVRKVLRVGLRQIKGVSKQALTYALNQRGRPGAAGYKPYESPLDFFTRVPLDAVSAGNLIRSGALDSLLTAHFNGDEFFCGDDSFDSNAHFSGDEIMRDCDSTNDGRSTAGHEDMEVCEDMEGCESLRGYSKKISRPALFWIYHSKDKAGGLFGLPEVPACVKDYTQEQKIRDQIDTLGLLISAHPLTLYRTSISNIGSNIVNNISSNMRNKKAGCIGCIEHIDSRRLKQSIDKTVLIAGMFVTQKEVPSADHRNMSFISFEDPGGIFETVMFHDAYTRYCSELDKSAAFLIQGTVEEAYGALQIVIDALFSLPLYYSDHH